MFEVHARACSEGERYTVDLSCEKCPLQFYSYVAQKSQGSCLPCNTRAICYGMNNTAPKPGYWRANATKEEYFECPEKEACLGGNITDPFGQCAEGYQGIMCAECSEGYVKSGPRGCSKCYSLFWHLLTFNFLFIFLFMVIILLVRS